jgi:hypothetical protein
MPPKRPLAPNGTTERTKSVPNTGEYTGISRYSPQRAVIEQDTSVCLASCETSPKRSPTGRNKNAGLRARTASRHRSRSLKSQPRVRRKFRRTTAGHRGKTELDLSQTR